jgi:hypothetical protein
VVNAGEAREHDAYRDCSNRLLCGAAPRACGNPILSTEGLDPLQLDLGFHLRMIKIPAELMIHPKTGGRAEDTRESQSRIRGERTPSVYETIDPLERNLNTLSQVSLRDPKRFKELLKEHLARMRRRPMRRNCHHYRNLLQEW